MGLMFILNFKNYGCNNVLEHHSIICQCTRKQTYLDFLLSICHENNPDLLMFVNAVFVSGDRLPLQITAIKA